MNATGNDDSGDEDATSSGGGGSAETDIKALMDIGEFLADFGVEISELNTPHYDTKGSPIINFTKVGKNVKMLYNYSNETIWDEVFFAIQCLGVDIGAIYDDRSFTIVRKGSWVISYETVVSWGLDTSVPIEMDVVLRLRAGGKGVSKKTKDKKNQVAEKLKKEVMEISGKVQNSHVRNLEPVKAIEVKIQEMMATQNPQEMLKNLAMPCNSIEKLNECITLLDRSDKTLGGGAFEESVQDFVW